MKKSFYSILNVVLCFLLISCLFGCSSNTPKETEIENNNEQQEQTNNENEENVINDAEKEDEPVVTEPVIISEGTDLVNGLTDSQLNSLAMLNYLATLTQEINSKKNSRMFLEEAYASLINNTSPDKVNDLTQSHLASLLDNIEKYRMVVVKRDRLQYIYEQNKAKALKESMPNPIGLLSAVSSLDLKRIAASAIYMAVDSYSSYKAYNAEMDLQYMKDGWELDDEESAVLHDSRKRAFMYMVDTYQDEKLKGNYALNEKSVENFVKYQNNENNYEKLQFFESEKSTYEAFGLYWLELAKCYYESEDYENCLSAMNTYESLQTGIFRKDYYLSRAIPNAIVAASKTYDTDKYISEAKRYLEILENNTERSDWSLRYFAAQIYIDLYSKTKDAAFIDKAYNLALNNVTELVAEQRKQNSTYLADVVEVKEITVDKENANDKEKENAKSENKKIKEYNKALKENRKTELSPVYEPLTLNLDLLFALAEERNVSSTDKNKIEGILRNNGCLFLSKQLENTYSFNIKKEQIVSRFDKDELILPADYLSNNSKISVRIEHDGKTEKYDDWTISEVKRPSNKIEEFTATYKSKLIKDYSWNPNTVVYIDVTDNSSSEPTVFTIKFNVNYTSRWWIIPDSIDFVQVD